MTTAIVNKWGLLVGINHYPLLEARYQLNGCVNDIELMDDLLQCKFGFSAANITKLTNTQATRAGILAALDNLVKRVQTNDIVVIHYSGHGSQRTDGPEHDEPDGMDETIVPHDSGRGLQPNRDISDDELYLYLQQLSQMTPYVTFIFDCCHSGTITRDTFGLASRSVEPDTRPASQFPSLPIPQAVARDLRDGKRDVLPSGWLPLGKRYVLIAGCQDAESSYEYQGEGVQHGALTYFWGQGLKTAESGNTYRDIFERASVQVTAAAARQHPQMEGACDREVFGIRELAPMHFVAVKERHGNSVTLAAGAAHGLTAKSKWAIYPQRTKQVTAQTAPLGMVEISNVCAVTATAQIVAEAQPDAIQIGGRAVEEEHFYGEMRLVVEIQAPAEYTAASAELQGLIEQSKLLRLAQAGETATTRIYLLAPRTQAASDPVPQVVTITEPTWAVVGQDGKLLLPLHRVGETCAATTVRDNLEKRVRCQQALQLRNPNPASLLKDKVEFTLLRQQLGGGWEEACPTGAEPGQTAGAGLVNFAEEERIAARIVNHYNAPIYVTLLDFGLTGAVTQLHPPAGASEELPPGASLEIGVRQGDEITLFMPENFPYAPDPQDKTGRSRATSAGDVETFKLFATTQPANFSLLVQEGYKGLEQRDAKGPNTPLAQLLELALTGYGTRDIRRVQVFPDEEWTTLERSFFLRRKLL